MALADLPIVPSGAAGALNNVATSQANPINLAKNGRQKIDSVINGWLVKPAGVSGIDGFLFDYEGESVLVADNDITDHYTESNRFFQDHVAVKPIEITMRGFRGEVVQKKPQGLLGLLESIQNRLTELPGLLGKYTPGAIQKIQKVTTGAINTVNKIDNAISRAQGLMNMIANGSPAPTEVEKAFVELMAKRDNGTIFTLASPWGFLTYLDPQTGKPGPRYFVIKRLTFTSSEDTKTWVDIAVTMKEIRYVHVQSSNGLTADAAKANNSGRAAFQRQGPTNKGVTSGTPAAFSNLQTAFGATA